jgi:hypothetical protein
MGALRVKKCHVARGGKYIFRMGEKGYIIFRTTAGPFLNFAAETIYSVCRYCDTSALRQVTVLFINRTLVVNNFMVR